MKSRLCPKANGLLSSLYVPKHINLVLLGQTYHKPMGMHDSGKACEDELCEPPW